MFYVYFLKSLQHNFRYTGYTSNLDARLDQHNKGFSKSTKPFLPFEIEAFIAVQTEEKVKNLEKYFKTGSGIAFARERIISYEISSNI